MKAIIVGNAASVLKKLNGDLIDSFDVVVRINKYKISSYEHYVGTKTDVYCSKWLNMGTNINNLISVKNLWLPYPKPPHWWTSRGNFFEQSREDSEKLTQAYGINPIYLSQKGAEEFEVMIDKQCQPSTGLICLKIATEQFLNHEIYYTGFDAFSTGWYWEPNRNCTINMKNSILFEKIVLNKLKKLYGVKELQ